MLVAASYAGPGAPEPLTQADRSIQACVRGDWGAWRQFHREYASTVAAFLRRLGVMPSDLDDASQEVFLQLFRSLSQFRGQAELKTWLYRICATHAFRLRRKRRLLTRLTELFSSAEPAAEATASAEDAYAARTLLDRAMNELPDGERLVFVLFELEGLSGAEVAKVADCPINTVWRRLFDARRRLQAAVAKASE